MNFTLMPSLEHMSLVRIAVALWNQDDIWFLRANFNHRECFLREWREIESKVEEKGRQISLPKCLKKKVLCFIKPIGLEIFKWNDCHDVKIHHSHRDVTNALCWTPQGTVNKKETAKALINHECLDIKSRYRLACIYCLENDIFKLWNEIPENDRNCIALKQRKEVWQNDLITIWTCYLEVAKKRDNFRNWNYMDSPLQKAFHSAAISGNISAVGYFWQKLTPEGKEKSLETFTSYLANEPPCSYSFYYTDDCADVLCFLLPQMSEEELFKVFESCADKVLTCLLDWPWQSFFMEMANRMGDLLSGETYFTVLNQMVIKREDGYKDFNYQKLFWEFWTQSPNTHKRYILQNDFTHHCLMPKLLEMEDKESIKLILKDASLEEKKDIIIAFMKTKPCVSLIYHEKWDLLKFFVQECTSSKEEFEYHIGCFHSAAKERKEISTIRKRLMDNPIHESNNKRNIEQEDNSPAKKLHMEFKGSNT